MPSGSLLARVAELSRGLTLPKEAVALAGFSAGITFANNGVHKMANSALNIGDLQSLSFPEAAVAVAAAAAFTKRCQLVVPNFGV